jgi:outer membrane protein
MSRVTQFLIAAVFLIGPSAAFAEDMKVGYVDMQRALNETDDGRKAKEKLKKEFDQKQKELDEQQNQLKKEIEDLDKKRSLLTPDKIRDKETELRTKLEKVQQTYMRHQKDLSEKEQKETAKIFERMQKIIGEIAAAENFSMIVDKTALVYAKPHLDLTNDLIRRYNKGATSGGAPPAAPKTPPPAKK